MKDPIKYETFSQIELRVAEILIAERVQGSDKLLKLIVNLGHNETRQIMAGIGKTYQPEVIVGKKILIVANLEPRTLMGQESQGMLLAASTEAEGPILLIPDQSIDAGAEVR